jgi:hypothetical protein
MNMSTQTATTAPTMPACPSWCPGHGTPDREGDIALWEDTNRWGLSCSAPAVGPTIYGHDPERFEYVSVGWGATTWQDGQREYGIRLDTMGQQDLSVEEARQIAAHLRAAADAMEAAQQ